MRVLVTGGTSLVGSHVARLLKDRGDDVVLFQRGSGPAGYEQRLGDVSDAGAVTAAVAGIDAVVHMAARVGIVGSWAEFEDTNVNGTANLIAASWAEGVSRFVYVSSPSVAHTGESLVGADAGVATPDAVRGHYSKSKAQAELLALEASGPSFPVLALRPHLIWGPGDNQLVGRIVERARQGRLATIGTGMALIDTTYVSNAASAIVAGLDRAPEVEGRALVVSNGEPRPVAELVSRIVRAAGLEPPRLKVPYAVAKAGGRAVERVWDRTERDAEPPMTSFLAEQLATAHWFDQRETRRALQWEPEVSLAAGFENLQEWFAHRSV
ncbi:MAG: NAD-dependent epimerase/dehydratase family protein [bacterium]|nr:NAD-dependent epimerase/dehydratase family protein [bacterium]